MPLHYITLHFKSKGKHLLGKMLSSEPAKGVERGWNMQLERQFSFKNGDYIIVPVECTVELVTRTVHFIHRLSGKTF